MNRFETSHGAGGPRNPISPNASTLIRRLSTYAMLHGAVLLSGAEYSGHMLAQVTTTPSTNHR